MKKFTINGEERLKTGHAHHLSGTLKFLGACPACTLNRITKLMPAYLTWQTVIWYPISSKSANTASLDLTNPNVFFRSFPIIAKSLKLCDSGFFSCFCCETDLLS